MGEVAVARMSAHSWLVRLTLDLSVIRGRERQVVCWVRVWRVRGAISRGIRQRACPAELFESYEALAAGFGARKCRWLTGHPVSRRSSSNQYKSVRPHSEVVSGLVEIAGNMHEGLSLAVGIDLQ